MKLTNCKKIQCFYSRHSFSIVYRVHNQIVYTIYLYKKKNLNLIIPMSPFLFQYGLVTIKWPPSSWIELGRSFAHLLGDRCFEKHAIICTCPNICLAVIVVRFFSKQFPICVSNRLVNSVWSCDHLSYKF